MTVEISGPRPSYGDGQTRPMSPLTEDATYENRETGTQSAFEMHRAIARHRNWYCFFVGPRKQLQRQSQYPLKGGDGKPRVLASSEKPWKTSRRT